MCCRGAFLYSRSDLSTLGIDPSSRAEKVSDFCCAQYVPEAVVIIISLFT